MASEQYNCYNKESFGHYLVQSSRRPCLEHGNDTDLDLDLCSCAYEGTRDTSLHTDITDGFMKTKKTNSNMAQRKPQMRESETGSKWPVISISVLVCM